MKQIHLINSTDNTGSALEHVVAGEICYIERSGTIRTFKAIEDIPFAFKIAVENIPQGTDVIKYGEVIGEASQDIHIGECVHIHNVVGKRAQTAE